MKKKKIFTFTSLPFFALPIIPAFWFLIFLGLASIPPDGGAFVTMCGIAAFVLCIFSFPVTVIVGTLGVIGFQIVAIVRKEILWLNILFIVLSLALCFLGLWFFQELWLGMMSV